MEQSQVLALKYRPKSFSELIGQESVSQTLTQALNADRLSHAYLFSGLRGSGKTSTARIFAKSLVCQNAPTPTPCEACASCIMASEGRHLDIIEMDAASNGGKEEIKELIEHTKYRPSVAKYKIFIIDEVHMLSKAAFNALLKTLEEPPLHVKFILATTDPLKLPATILSRTQHFKFKQISRANIVHHLSKILDKEGVGYELEALEMLSRSGGGSLRDTLTLLDQAILFSKGDVKSTNIAQMLGLLDPKKLEEIFDFVLNSDKKALLEVVEELGSSECESIIDEMIAYLKERFFEQDVKFSVLVCERFFRILAQAKELLFMNADNAFVLSLVFFKMIEALNIKRIDEVIKELEQSLPTQEANTHKSEIHTPVQSPNITKQKSPYEQLKTKIYDREFNLGESFEKFTKFISYENGELTISMSKSDEIRASFRKNYAIIKHFIDEIFGLGTKLVVKDFEVESQIIQAEQIEAEIEVAEEAVVHAEELPKSIEYDPAVIKAGELLGVTKMRVIEKL